MVTIQIHASVDETMSMTGYETKTTFWMDFPVADKSGIEAVVDTLNRAFDEWHTNHVCLTGLVMVLNHKIWQWHGKNDSLAGVYDRLWRKAGEWAQGNLHGGGGELLLRGNGLTRKRGD